MRKLDFTHISKVHEQVSRENAERAEALREAEQKRKDDERFAKPSDIVGGSRIWRGVAHGRMGRLGQREVRIFDYGTGSEARNEIVLSEDKRGKPVGILRASYGFLLVKSPIWIAVGGKKGMVCFIYEDLPVGWTYLEVVRVAIGGKSCVARPIVGTREEILSQYEE